MNFIRNKPLLSFVLLNYLISWTFLYPCYQLLLNAEEGHFPPLALIGFIGAFGPTIAAIIIERICNGKEGLSRLLKKYLIWKIPARWYIFTFFIPVLLYGLATISSGLFGFQLGSLNLAEAIGLAVPYFLVTLPFGPMAEELGWRGFMMPRLLEKYSVVKASLILGVLWSIWHLASFSFPGAAIPSIFEVNAKTLLLYLLNITAETFLFTVLFLNTRGSVFLAILFHAAFNSCSNIVLAAFPDVASNVPQRELIYTLNIILMSLSSGLLLWRFRSRTAKAIVD